MDAAVVLLYVDQIKSGRTQSTKANSFPSEIDHQPVLKDGADDPEVVIPISSCVIDGVPCMPLIGIPLPSGHTLISVHAILDFRP